MRLENVERRVIQAARGEPSQGGAQGWCWDEKEGESKAYMDRLRGDDMTTVKDHVAQQRVEIDEQITRLSEVWTGRLDPLVDSVTNLEQKV